MIVSTVILCSCYPNQRAVDYDSGSAKKMTTVMDPTKVYFLDGSVGLYPQGLTIDSTALYGNGQFFTFDGTLRKRAIRRIPLDSVTAMTYYQEYQTGGSGFASFLLGLYGVIFTPLSIYCISCPKCCFGSCPTVYHLGNNNSLPDAELFSYSISRFFQEYDFDRIAQTADPSDTLVIRLANEAMETHYIDLFKIYRIDHPEGTIALPTPDGEVKILNKIFPPARAKTPDGREITHLIAEKDSNHYRTNAKFKERINYSPALDWLDLEIEFGKAVAEFELVLRLRNSLLTTVLFYDLVLANQGVEAISWTARMQNDYFYARVFTELYRQYAGIRFYVNYAGNWQEIAKIGDVGPIAWKDMAIPVKLPSPADKITLRMTFFPDNFIFDQVNVSTESHKNIHPITECSPQSIADYQGRYRDDIARLLETADKIYLITNPGEYYDLTFYPEATENKLSTYFIGSKGYYIEWLRGSWIHNDPTKHYADFLNPQLVLNYIANSWEKERSRLESVFFDSRIPLRRLP